MTGSVVLDMHFLPKLSEWNVLFPERHAQLFISALCDCSVSIVSWDEDDDIMNSCGTNFLCFFIH